MRFRPFIVASIVLGLMFCKGSQETPATTTSVTTQTTTTSVAGPPPVTQTTATQPAPQTASAPAGSSLASQETNWPGITAEVTEFRRKGNTLTAKVRFVNKGSEEPEVEVNYSQVYLIDTAGGKKYEALRDEKGEYIASLNPNWHDRWYQRIKAAASATIWVKFPAPPAEVKAITLNIPKTPPFEDVPIQE